MDISKNDKIIAAARTVFLRYGYKRVTMNDIAEAAKISRPAVYLAFQNKEEVFKAVIKHSALKSMDEIRAGIAQYSSTAEKLFYAFELWVVRPFEIIKKAPEAEELLSSAHGFCKVIYDEIGSAFETELVKILRPHIKQHTLSLSAPKMAHMMRCAARGFRECAENAVELRQMIKSLIQLVCPS